MTDQKTPSQSASDPVLYTRLEASKIARMSLASFDEALKRGQFRSIRIGRRVLIPRIAFERALCGDDAK